LASGDADGKGTFLSVNIFKKIFIFNSYNDKLFFFTIYNKYVNSSILQISLVYVWDWKSTKNLRTFKAHDDICMGVAWHPIEPSKMVSWGWDNVIKYWD
jgi:WD40 repeat protein